MADDNNRWEEFNLIIDNFNLDIKEKGLLLVIFRYVNYKTGYADPSRALIKKLTGIKKDETLDKIFNSLIEKGFVVRCIEKGKRSKYFIKVHLKNGGTTINEGTPKNSSTVPPINGGILPPKIGGQKENKRKIKENIYSANDLEKIWSLYPNKKGKSISMKKIPKLLKKYGKEQMERCIVRYSKEVEGKEKQYILNGSTFFNGRYEDYLDNNFIEEIKSKGLDNLEDYIQA
ncbi:hypothetical protein EXM65_14305 [Clostridium botulinum]|uniref:Helix-turn-helix domain-containing protein n=1 Tax=Clostridium botulinum TaxID=1491 RepID=A0A6M0SQX1_CLOBO|nr:hypothetical protein [Clostridium botulinum]NFA43700.1 hypothetical protein [Clostridium botulinum]